MPSSAVFAASTLMSCRTQRLARAPCLGPARLRHHRSMDPSTFLDTLRSDTLRLTARLEKAAAAHSDESWERTPARGWSPAGIVRHMVLTQAPYLRVLPSVVEHAPPAGQTPISHTWFGKMLIQGAGPQGNSPAPKSLHPGPGPHGRGVVDEWIAQQSEFLRLLEAARGKDLSGTRFRNPFVPIFRMSLADAFAVAVAHTERHVSQIEARTV